MDRIYIVFVIVYGRQVQVAKAVLQASIDGKKIEPGNDL